MHDAVGARVDVRGRHAGGRFVAEHHAALARLAEASFGSAANRGDRASDSLYRKVGVAARHSDRRAECDHPLDHLGMLARNLARVNAAEALTDHDDRLPEFLVGKLEPRAQLAHRLARTFGVRQDAGIDGAMPEPSAEIRQRRERHVAGHEARNQHDDFGVMRLGVRPRMRQRAEPVDAGLERHAELAQCVDHRRAFRLYFISRRNLRDRWSHRSPWSVTRAGNVSNRRHMHGETATSSSLCIKHNHCLINCSIVSNAHRAIFVGICAVRHQTASALAQDSNASRRLHIAMPSAKFETSGLIERTPSVPVKFRRSLSVKKKPRFGQLIKASRQSAGLSQRELGRSVGVTASHIAYIESGTRHPSRSVVLRLAETLRIDRQELIRAAYPELAPSIASNGNHKQAWRGFVAVARRHSVTPREMTVMRQISLIGRISSSSSYLFILNTIRQSLDSD